MIGILARYPRHPDTVRLDWLEKHPVDVYADRRYNTLVLFTKARNLRVKIDAEMAKETPVAQRLEPSAHNGLVEGSNPSGRTARPQPAPDEAEKPRYRAAINSILSDQPQDGGDV